MTIVRLKILIADDHQPMREMIKKIVADLASEVFEANNGEETLRIYRQHRPDLVLMDLMMPGMGGLVATQMLILEFPQARVIIVTQQDQPVLREAARKAGARGYVLKENLLQIRDFIETPKPSLCT